MDDPFFRLEKDEEDKVKASEQHQIISKLYEKSHRQWSDPWTQNQKLRKAFREEKKLLKQKSKLTEDIRYRNGLHIDLLPETEEDAAEAKIIDYEGPEGREAALRRRELKTGALLLGKRDRNGDSKKKQLERVVKLNTLEHTDPFLRGAAKVDPQSFDRGLKVVKKRDASDVQMGATVGLVDGYSSSE